MAKRTKAQKDKRRSAKQTYTTKDRVTRTPVKIASELRCSGMAKLTVNSLKQLFMCICLFHM
jgi:hypothetical protein